jgi:WD40 repeat protein
MKKTMVVVAALALGALAVESCGSKKESLVVVSLTANPASADLSAVTIDVASVSRTFTFTGGLDATTPTMFGVYVPDSITGLNILVAATAHAGTMCYSGRSNDTNIASAGVSVTTSIVMRLGKTCGDTSGMAGSMMGTAGTGGAGGEAGAAGAMGAAGASGSGGGAGTMGEAGAGGTGGAAGAAGGMGTAGMGTAGAAGTMGTAGTGQVLAPPSLAKCTEYNHIDALSCTPTSASGGNTSLWDVAFSPDGKLLVTAGDDGRIKVWKMTGSVPSAEGHVLTTNGQAYVAFSPNGKYLVEGSQTGEYKVYDAATFAPVGDLAGHADDIVGVAFTSDSKSVWAIDYFNGVLTRHEIGTAAASLSITTRGTGYTLAVSPVMSANTQWVAVGYDDGTADIANLGTSTPMTTPISIAPSTLYYTFALSFSKDGSILVGGADDGTLGFWAIPPNAGGTPSGAAVHIPDGMGAPMPIRAARYSPDGKTIAVGAGSIAGGMWNLATVDPTARTVKNTKMPTYEPISVAWSPNGGIVVAGETSCGKFIVCAD